MPEWLSQLSAFGIFLAIGAVGFLFLLVSLIFGELFEGLFDADHDIDGDHGGPGFFSTRVIAVFITAFGGFGAIGIRYGLSTLTASLLGAGSGVVFGGIVYAFARFLYSQQSSSEVRTADLVGQVARVIVTIPAGGLGQVRCQIGEALVDKIARTQDGAAVPENSMVKIEEVLGETVVVKRQ
jgi:membrane protein implicated in regulation of membrane protease activity